MGRNRGVMLGNRGDNGWHSPTDLRKWVECGGGVARRELGIILSIGDSDLRLALNNLATLIKS